MAICRATLRPYDAALVSDTAAKYMIVDYELTRRGESIQMGDNYWISILN